MIDWDRAKQLRTEVGAEDFLDIVELFLEEVDEEIEKLAQHSCPGVLQDRLHFLKGSALNLGFSALSKLCHDGERDAANGTVEGAVLSKIQSTYAKSKILFKNELSSRF